MDIIKVADYLIDLGPEGGKSGGQVVARGTPEQLVQKSTADSYTAFYLEKEL
jgi:excinuclease ABC subunit A